VLARRSQILIVGLPQKVARFAIEKLIGIQITSEGILSAPLLVISGF
jgi:hypothetical protein